MKIQGHITQLKARLNASGDTVQTLTIEAHGEFFLLHGLLRKPLEIELSEIKNSPFDEVSE